MKKSSYTINQEAEIIYNDWLSRNPQVQNKTYLTTFNKLPKGLQGFLKYASILGKKIAKSNYRYSLASTAHELIDDIENFGIRANKNFYFDYCGARFYTAIDTADSVYLKLTGLTQDEYLDALRHIKLNTKNSLTETHKKIFRSVRYKEKRKFCEFVLELFESVNSDEEILNELYSGKYTEKLEELEDKNLQAYLYLISKTTILNGNKKSLHRFTVDKKKGYYVAYNNARMESQRQEIKNLVKEYNPEKEF